MPNHHCILLLFFLSSGRLIFQFKSSDTPEACSMAQEFMRYEAMYDYAVDKRGDIEIKEKDILIVNTNIVQYSFFKGTLENPKGWLLGRNERTNEEGTFPGPFVRFIGKSPPVPVPRQRPGRVGSTKEDVPGWILFFPYRCHFSPVDVFPEISQPVNFSIPMYRVVMTEDSGESTIPQICQTFTVKNVYKGASWVDQVMNLRTIN